MPVVLESLRFEVFDRLLAEGEAYHAAVEAARAEEKRARAAGGAAPGARSGGRRRKTGETLRDRDPW